MPKYIILFEKTEDGLTITAEEAQERRAKGIELTQKYGVELLDLYYGVGDTDMVAIAEAPDTESIAKVKLAYEQLGLAKTKGFEVFDPEEWDRIVEDAL